MHKACKSLPLTVFWEIAKAKQYLMPNLLLQLQVTDNRLTATPLVPVQGFIPIEPRQPRRLKVKDTAKAPSPTRASVSK